MKGDLQGSQRDSPPIPMAPVTSHASTTPFPSEGQLRWELYRYRVSYLFSPKSCRRFCRSVRMRLPTGVGVYVVLIMLGLEQLAFTSAAEMMITSFLSAVGLVGHNVRPVVRIVGLNLLANLLFPVTGWLADVWIGRRRMIHLSMWLLWCGYAFAALTFSLEEVIQGNWNEYLLLPCYLLVNFGSAAFQANAIPFGADQIPYKTSHELSSYFYVYYWLRNWGSVMLCLLVTCEGFDGHIQGTTYTGIAVLAITVNLCLYATLRSELSVSYEKRNPLKMVFKVVYSSLIAKRPTHRSAFSYNPGASQPSRIDLTKAAHGGKFREETVEDVKTFLRLLAILGSLGIVLLAYVGVSCYVLLLDRKSVV